MISKLIAALYELFSQVIKLLNAKKVVVETVNELRTIQAQKVQEDVAKADAIREAVRLDSVLPSVDGVHERLHDDDGFKRH